MSKGLNEFLGQSLKEFEGISLKKVDISKVDKIWTFYLEADKRLNITCINSIKGELKKKLKLPFDIDIVSNLMEPMELNIENLKNDEVFLNLLESACGEDSPMFCSMVKPKDCEIKDKNLTIYIENPFVRDIFIKKSVDNKIKDYLKKRHEIDLNVIIKEKNSNGYDYNHLKEEEDKKYIQNCLSSKETAFKDKGIVKEKVKSDLIVGKSLFGEEVEIGSIHEEMDKLMLSGEVFKTELKQTKNGKFILIFYITDHSGSITVKLFLKPEDVPEVTSRIKNGVHLKVSGKAVFDSFEKEIVFMGSSIKEFLPEKKMDTCDEKRVELHLHTQMSSMDGVSAAKDLVKRAKEWGHRAIAITDHGVVQAFPEAMDAGKNYGIKVIYGVEAYLVDDGEPIVLRPDNRGLSDSFVVFDIETTGLSSTKEDIIEIGAVKVNNYEIIGRFSTFVKPSKSIPFEITKLTGINDEMVSNAPSIEEALNAFLEFTGDCPVAAHNAKFDTGFVKEKLKAFNKQFLNPIIDTLPMARWLLPELKKYKLDIVCKHLDISLENHHRAVDDAEATALMFLKFINKVLDLGGEKLCDINSLYAGNFDVKKGSTYHTIILVKNYEGLYNLYKLISKSHLEYFHKRPRMPKSLIQSYRDGLIIGSACEAGQVYRAILKDASNEELRELVKFYDYLEIQPRGNNKFLIDNGTIKDEEGLFDINRKIVELGKKYNKMVVATGDVHFLEKEDEYMRRILMAGQGFEDADNQAPLYFKTTDEMLSEFSYLGEETALDVVVKNPNAIADSVEEILPIPKGTFPPKIDGAEEEIKGMTLKRAHEIYGEKFPEIVEKRLDKELNSIINNGYAVLYLIAHKLVAKSNADGYLVGSRGSVGSSFVATMCGITEVNPLPPHYVCPECKNTEFFTDGSIGSGADLPDKNCSLCGHKYIKDGHDIPFEVFLGFEGDKEPDIDLNFSGDYQPVAHKYTEELFGVGHVFRAGTIGTIAEKTAFGFVKNYLDEKRIRANKAEIERLLNGCTGIKRTTGQHPGGVMVVPRDREIYEFTPIQRPADDVNSDIITTHFDYHSISGRLLKLDILGHDDPTVIRMLQDLTGISPKTIPLGDSKVLSLFTSPIALGVSSEDIKCEVGTLGLPEFGTKFVRQMLLDTKPKTFAELVRISGLSHGTDVWVNNAQDIIKKGYATLKEVTSTRDDIMIYLIQKGVKPKIAFTIMERVRKGKGLRDEDINELKSNNVPEWYIESCQKIKYMFPKGHAVAYVMMAVRIAYFKVYYPMAYYATYYTVRADDFDADIISKGEEAILSKMKEIESLDNEATNKDKGLYTILEIAYEMYKRGIKMLPVDLYKSDAVKFIITEDGLLPPFNTLQGCGDSAARSIVKAREDGPFISREELRNRARVSKTVIEVLENHGSLNGLPETSQISLF